MTDEELMALAADLGAQSVREGWGGPFGAVIARDGEVQEGGVKKQGLFGLFSSSTDEPRAGR